MPRDIKKVLEILPIWLGIILIAIAGGGLWVLMGGIALMIVYILLSKDDYYAEGIKKDQKK